jgi:hypothetical protein
MPYMHGKFKPAGGHSAGAPTHAAGAVHSAGNKPAPTPNEHEHGMAQTPHGGSSEEHVTKTHPGKTQPHPVTGVHAFHSHHQGGGKYESHTHHDGGEVETRQHPDQQDMAGAMNEALPPEGEMGGRDQIPEMGEMEGLSGIGGSPETE